MKIRDKVIYVDGVTLNVMVDCPPSLSRATRMSLVAAHGIIVPNECQQWAVKGASRLEIPAVVKLETPRLRTITRL